MLENENHELKNEEKIEEKNDEFSYQPEGEGLYPTTPPHPQPVMANAASLASQHSLDKVVKQIRDASSTAMFIATLNIGLGALFTLISADFIGDIFEDTFIEPTVGFAYIIFGLIFLVLSVGIYFRSRLCALAALVAFGADAFLLIRGDGLDFDNIVGLVMRGALLIALLLGTFACIRYHSMRRKFAYSEDVNIAAAVQDSKAKMGAGRLLLYIVVGLVGIATLIYAASTGVFETGRGFNRWHEHEFFGITVQVPSADIEEETERIDGIPGVVVSATSATRAVVVELIAFTGITDDPEAYNVTHDNLVEFGAAFLDGMMSFAGVRDRRSSRGTMAGGISYSEVSGTNDGQPFTFRSFVVDGYVYIIGINVASERDTDLFQQFFDSIVRN